MNYELKITKKEPNPAYKPPRNMSDIYHQSYDVPQYSIFEVLSIEVTAEQFEAIRKEVLKTF